MSQENVEAARLWIEEHPPPVPPEAFEPLEFIDAGADAILFIAVVAGPEHPHRHGSVFRVRDGKVVDWQPYPSEQAAREAVGLSEETLTPTPEEEGAGCRSPYRSAPSGEPLLNYSARRRPKRSDSA